MTRDVDDSISKARKVTRKYATMELYTNMQTEGIYDMSLFDRDLALCVVNKALVEDLFKDWRASELKLNYDVYTYI